MKVNVYRLRERGKRLPGDQVKERGPVLGELVYRPRLYRTTIMLASLVADDMETYLIPPMDQAVLLQVNERGMLIGGTEVITRRMTHKARSDSFRQAWWVVPVSVAAPGDPAGPDT